MRVYTVQDQDGKILSVHRTPDGVAHQVAGHGGGAAIDGADLEIDAIDRALSNNGATLVTYTDGTPSLSIEYHAILV